MYIYLLIYYSIIIYLSIFFICLFICFMLGSSFHALLWCGLGEDFIHLILRGVR